MTSCRNIKSKMYINGRGVYSISYTIMIKQYKDSRSLKIAKICLYHENEGFLPLRLIFNKIFIIFLS